jgi:LPXTG-motif cell wall-anchored protein
MCLAGAALVVAVPAQADSPASSADLADAAHSAAQVADNAFIDADFATVQAKIDAFWAAYNELLARRDAAATAAADADAAEAAAATEFDDAQAAYDSLATPLQRLDNAEAALELAETSVINRLAALEQAQATLGTIPPTVERCLFQFPGCQVRTLPNPAYVAQQIVVAAAQGAYDLAVAAVGLAEDLVELREQQLEDLGADEIVARLIAAEEAYYAAAEAEEDADATLAALEALLDGLADAAAGVADRAADLADLAHVRSVVVWTLGADNDEVRAGDLVKLNFTVPNSELYDLSDAQVTIESPRGVTPSCDIAGGVVAAGATVNCTAEYTPTDADAKAGKVVFEVKLTGYIPLGPGNPRAAAATRTLIETAQTIEVAVAPALVPASAGGSGDELADTGADGSTAAVALALLLAGAGLLVARRRLEAAQL